MSGTNTRKQVSASDPRAEFVGVKAYLAAGGTLERDLFDDEHEGYLTDPALVDRLVAERCEKIVADLLSQGWAWAKPHLENNYWEVLQKYNRLQPGPVTLSEDLVAEAEKLQAELDAIENDESGEYSQERIDEIETRLEEIEAAQTEFSTEQKSRAGVIFAISHGGKPSYHYGLIERGAKACDQNGDQTGNTSSEEDRFSAALLEDLTIQRTAALRAELAARTDVALVAVTHNLASQVFYEQFYSLPTALTVRTEAYTDRIDLRSPAESPAVKALAKQTEAVRKGLPPEIDDLWQWLIDQPQNVLLNVLAVATAHTVNAVQRPHDEPSSGRLGAAKALAQALDLDMAKLVAGLRFELLRAREEGPNYSSHSRGNRSSG